MSCAFSSRLRPQRLLLLPPPGRRQTWASHLQPVRQRPLGAAIPPAGRRKHVCLFFLFTRCLWQCCVLKKLFQSTHLEWEPPEARKKVEAYLSASADTPFLVLPDSEPRRDIRNECRHRSIFLTCRWWTGALSTAARFEDLAFLFFDKQLGGSLEGSASAGPRALSPERRQGAFFASTLLRCWAAMLLADLPTATRAQSLATPLGFLSLSGCKPLSAARLAGAPEMLVATGGSVRGPRQDWGLGSPDTGCLTS